MPRPPRVTGSETSTDLKLPRPSQTDTASGQSPRADWTLNVSPTTYYALLRLIFEPHEDADAGGE